VLAKRDLRDDPVVWDAIVAWVEVQS
jgi:hypothetical protein